MVEVGATIDKLICPRQRRFERFGIVIAQSIGGASIDGLG